MTHVEKRGETTFVYIAEEPSGRCELCGAVEETRPYGPGGKQVCFSCGMKDERGAEQQFERRIAEANRG